MNRKEYKEFYKNEMASFDSFVCVVFMALIIAINIQTINTFLAKYNNLLNEFRGLIMLTGLCFVLAAILIRRALDRKEQVKSRG